MKDYFDFNLEPGSKAKHRLFPQAHTFAPHGGGGGPGSPGDGGSPPPPQKDPNESEEQFQERMRQFEATLAETQRGLGLDIGALVGVNKGLGGDIGFLGGLRDQFGQLAQGNDPRFAAFQQSQFDLLNQQRTAQTEQAQAQLARQGITGSAALNEANKINSQFDLQQRGLAGQLGLSQLGRQDRFLTGQAGLTGQISGVRGQQTGLIGQVAGIRSDIASNAAIPVGLDIANRVAQNAGGGGGGGGIFSFLPGFGG